MLHQYQLLLKIEISLPRCPEGYAGQRCQFKKALINLPFIESKFFKTNIRVVTLKNVFR